MNSRDKTFQISLFNKITKKSAENVMTNKSKNVIETSVEFTTNFILKQLTREK